MAGWAGMRPRHSGLSNLGLPDSRTLHDFCTQCNLPERSLNQCRSGALTGYLQFCFGDIIEKLSDLSDSPLLFKLGVSFCKIFNQGLVH